MRFRTALIWTLVLTSLALPQKAGADCTFSSEQYFYGMNVSALGATWTDIQDLGSRWVRVEYRSAVGDNAHYRKVIEAAHLIGVRVLLLVGYSLTPGKPAWNAGDAEWNAYRANFIDDLRPVAEELGAIVDAWEVWNEPDHQLPPEGYDPGVPATQFGLLLKEAAEVIRPKSAGELIIGGMATKRYSYITTARSAAGGSLDYDGLGVHTYGPPNWTATIVRNEIDLLVSQWYPAGGNLPIWFTEAGAVATPEAESWAVNYVNTLHTHTWAKHSTKVRTILYFSWHDSVGFATERFGLVRLDNTRKPSFTAYAALTPDYNGQPCTGPGLPPAQLAYELVSLEVHHEIVPTQTADHRVRVSLQNTGTTTWTSDKFSLASTPTNQWEWNAQGGGSCDSSTDCRVFLAGDVPASGIATFEFDLLLTGEQTDGGSYLLSLWMANNTNPVSFFGNPVEALIQVLPDNDPDGSIDDGPDGGSDESPDGDSDESPDGDSNSDHDSSDYYSDSDGGSFAQKGPIVATGCGCEAGFGKNRSEILVALFLLGVANSVIRRRSKFYRSL